MWIFIEYFLMWHYYVVVSNSKLNINRHCQPSIWYKVLSNKSINGLWTRHINTLNTGIVLAFIFWYNKVLRLHLQSYTSDWLYTFISRRLCLVSETLELLWYLFWLFLITTWSFQPYSLDQSSKLHLLSNLKFPRFLTPSFPNHESDTSNMQMIISQASQKFCWDKEKLQIHIHGVSTITDIHLFNRYIS